MTAYIQMKREDADKWLAALRSGEYKQTHHMLARTEDDGTESYCCLGVLQKILDGDVERSASGWACGTPTLGWLEAHGIVFLDEDLRACHVPYIEAEGRSVAILNDNGYTFAQIADILEKEILPTN